MLNINHSSSDYSQSALTFNKNECKNFLIKHEVLTPKSFLLNKNIQTSIHYPIPIHLQPASLKFGYKKGDFKNAENQSKRILTLPINENLSIKQIKYICKMINKFYK